MRTRVIIGAVLVALGAVWFGQGIGTIGGSFMSGHAIWAVIGAIVVFLGGSLLASARHR